MNYPPTILASLCLITVSCPATGGLLSGTPDPSSPPDKVAIARAQNKTRSAALDATNRAAFTGNTNVFLRPGLIADRSRQTVTIAAETIRLDLNAPVEFPLISEDSGKDYEALAVSFATPGDVHAALEFIGLPPGKTVNPSAMRFWPRGEPVTLTFTYDEPASPSNITRTVPATDLIIDNRTGKLLPAEPFLFTGSEWVPPPDPASGTNPVYAANVFSPNCIASVYNERTTVLDVPRRVAQHEVYSFLVPNPALRLPPAAFATITLEPQHKDGHRRVADLTLALAPGPIATLPWSLGLGKSLVQGAGMDTLATNLTRLAAADHDLYVTLQPADTLTLADLHRLARSIEAMEERALIRIEPPPSGHPYYKTFLPDEKHRSRPERPVQPWEFYLSSSTSGATGELIHVEEHWTNDGNPSTYTETRYPIPSAATLPDLFLKHDAPPVVLIFAAPATPYGTLRHFMAPLLERKMIVYVFEEKTP